MYRRPPLPLARALATALVVAIAACGGSSESSRSHLTLAPSLLPPLLPSEAVGSLEGTPGVSADGAATYRLALAVPPGRAGIEPSLALTYSSRSGDGLVGVGWSLSGLSRIDRCTNTLREGVVRGVEGSDRDRYCLDGQRLVAIAPSALCTGGVEHRTQEDTFARVVSCAPDAFGPTRWSVYAKDGRISTYGESATARVEAPRLGSTSQLRRLAWLLAKTEDRAGNTLTITWGREASGSRIETWPAQIAYAGFRSTVAPSRRVAFEYEPRPDPLIAHVAGVELATTRRLARVRMEAPSPAAQPIPFVRRYELRYEAGSLSGRSRLAAVKVCDHAGVCLPETAFAYTDAPAPTFERAAVVPNVRAGSHDAFVVSDFDGDGFDDLLYRDTGDQADPSRDRLAVRYGTRSGAVGPLTESNILSPNEVTRVSAYDFDGDGAVDVLAEGPSGTFRYRPPLFLQRGFTARLTPPFSLLLGGAGGRMVDLRGDLTSEVLQGLTVQPSGGAAWSLANTTAFAALGVASTDIVTSGVQAADIDGDRVTEVLVPHDRFRTVAGVKTLSGVGYTAVRVLDVAAPGLTETLPTTIVVPATLAEDPDGFTTTWTRPSLAGVVFADVTGDGLADWVDVCAGFTVRTNWGGGRFSEAVSALAPGVALEGVCVNGEPHGVHFVDVNQDGRSDVLLLGKTAAGAEPARVLIWSPGGFTPSPLPSIPLGAPADPRGGFGAGFSRVVDVDGDGLFDVTQLDPTAGALVVYRQTTRRADLLARVTNGWGAIEQELTYAPLTHTGYVRPVGGCTATTRCYVGPTVVVTREARNTRVSSGESPAAPAAVTAFTHAYDGARVDAYGEGWLGFERHTVTNAITGEVVDTTYDQSATQTGTVDGPSGRERHVFRGLPSRIVRVAGSIAESTQIERAVKNPLGLSASAEVWFPHVTRIETVSAEAGVTLRRTVETLAFDAFGNETARTEERGAGRVTAVSREYTNDTAKWLLGLLTLERRTSTANGRSTTRTTAFAYEPDGTGLLRDAVREPDGDATTKRCSRVAARDAFGNAVRVEVTPGGCAATAETRAATMLWDTEGVLPLGEVNALGHVTRWERHPGLGVAFRATDANGATTSHQFDGFGRPRREARPDGTYTETSYGAAGGYGLIVTTRASDGSERGVLHDRVGQPVRESSLGFAGTPVYIDRTYDAAGRVALLTRPYFAGTTPYAAARTTYDVAGRVVSVCQHDATRCRRTTYAGLTLEERDEDGKRTTTTLDAAGLLASSTLYPEGAPVTTTFEHGPFDTRTAVVDARGNRVTMSYDVLGRRTRLEDADLGYVETAYNAFDEVVRETTPPGHEGDGPVVKTLAYDALGRLVARVAPDGTDTFVYDSAPGAGVGRLASQARASADRHYAIFDVVTQRYTYDALGRVVSERWDLGPNDRFEVGHGYDAAGRLATTAYPEVPGIGRLVVEREYDARGLLSAVRASVPSPACAAGECPGGVAPTTLTRADALDAEGHVTRETLGNGIVTTRTFDPVQGLLTGETAARGPSVVHDVGYTFDANGNLRTRIDRRAGLTETFTYDGANRLASEQVGARAVVTHRYDALGNWVEQSDGELTLRFGEGGRGPHALTSACYRSNPALCPYAPTIDARGNMITGGGLTRYASMRHTSFDKPAYVERTVSSWADSAEAIVYDASHERVRRVTRAGDMGPFTDHVTVGRIYERRKSISAVEHVLSIDGVAQIVWRVSAVGEPQGGPRYLHRDRLGTVEGVTDAAGAVIERASYDAFGLPRNLDWTRAPSPFSVTSTSMRRGYTGHEVEREIETVNMGGRIYLPALRRFVEPDSIVQAPSYGPSWNRYAYAFGNPTRYTDPSGHIALSSVESIVQSAASAVKELVGGAVEMAATLSSQGRLEVSVRSFIRSMAEVKVVDDAIRTTLRTGRAAENAAVRERVLRQLTVVADELVRRGYSANHAAFSAMSRNADAWSAAGLSQREVERAMAEWQAAVESTVEYRVTPKVDTPGGTSVLVGPRSELSPAQQVLADLAWADANIIGANPGGILGMMAYAVIHGGVDDRAAFQRWTELGNLGGSFLESDGPGEIEHTSQGPNVTLFHR